MWPKPTQLKHYILAFPLSFFHCCHYSCILLPCDPAFQICCTFLWRLFNLPFHSLCSVPRVFLSTSLFSLFLHFIVFLKGSTNISWLPIISPIKSLRSNSLDPIFWLSDVLTDSHLLFGNLGRMVACIWSSLLLFHFCIFQLLCAVSPFPGSTGKDHPCQTSCSTSPALCCFHQICCLLGVKPVLQCSEHFVGCFMGFNHCKCIFMNKKCLASSSCLISSLSSFVGSSLLAYSCWTLFSVSAFLNPFVAAKISAVEKNSQGSTPPL